ncbi:ELWxxDGT repeat protein [Moheibacter sediminis]|uniref:Por secretion system C-terminal sorting domain-containing protein n=1 Tax=Moheibacter sediminis TaxID=1434700 RepID=A0A1W2CFQ5_9FLAO|nr:ELWxxDGT repeat protein [Moheibacter sediminis]SMC84087.1 Por secretion system C-terminal sorting domain-containing protein [Moheibacter sediminis]
MKKTFILASLLFSFLELNAQTPVFEMLKDINPSGDSMPTDLISFDEKLFFVAEDGESGRELWVTDSNDTYLFKDINPGANGSDISNFRIFDGKLFFTATDDANGNEIWISDGTVEGTQILKDIFPGTSGSYAFEFFEFNNGLYFRAEDGVHGTELWKTDGTEGGTVMVADLRIGEFGSNPSNFAILNNKIYFNANDGFDYENGQHGFELWVSDGTAAGTEIVADINTAESSNPSGMVTFGDKIYFSADNGINGIELWASDGTQAGTYMVKDIRTEGNGNSLPGHFIVFNDKLFFSAYTEQTGREMWVTDGTEQGTQFLKDANPGTSDGVIPQFRHFIYGEKLLLTLNDGVHGPEIWSTDGTSEGTQLYLDIFPGAEGSMGATQAPIVFYEFDGMLYFRAFDDFEEYFQLWQSDGTIEGTQKLMPNPENPFNGALAYSPFFTSLGNSLYFTAKYDENGYELWKLTFEDMAVSDFTQNQFSIYPNPVTDIINISGKSSISSVQIYDLAGKILSNQSFNSQEAKLNISSLPKGIYIIKLVSEGKTNSYKIIKK